MLPTRIKITKDDIKYAEQILLNPGQFFNPERQDFICNLNTIDLQAVPGSGKTTALLAKILILEKYLPLEDGSGILVISHTNAAIDEIEDKIRKYCPGLFSYPNFVGTIQSFVDRFLAIPFYVNKFKKKTYRIDDEIYDEKVAYYFREYLSSNRWIENNGGIEFLREIRFDINKNLTFGIDKKNEDFKLKDNKSRTYKALLEMKDNLLKWGYLHFDDAYFLANRYIKKLPQIKNILRKRFRFVFVDEMQDMDEHQHDLLEELFYVEGEDWPRYQRIGDLNQAIHNNVSSEDCWEPRESYLELEGSHRLTERIARVVKYFGLSFQEIKSLKDLDQEKELIPHIIIFANPENVLPRFVELIREYGLKDTKNKPFCAIGWRKEHKKKYKLGIKDYYPKFEEKRHTPKIDHSSLRQYLEYYKKEENPLAPIRRNILRAFVKILRMENIKDRNDRDFTITRLINYIKAHDRENQKQKYKKLKLQLFEWSFATWKGENIYEDLKVYIKPFLENTFPNITFSQEVNGFINSSESSNQERGQQKTVNKNNVFELDDIKVKVGTVHSEKGRTHTATLYMETSNYGNCEPIRLQKSMCGNKFSDVRKRHIQSAKMAYVGLSRSTHLLCFAIRQDHWNELCEETKEAIKHHWEVKLN